MERLLLDPHGRTMDMIFSQADLERLKSLVQIVWGKDEPMPDEDFAQAKREVSYIVTGRWRYGGVSEEEAPRLRAIMEVAGGLPSPASLDYDTCFRRGIRVLGCAPAFAPHVAELALGHAICLGRDIAEADRDLRSGSMEWGYADVTSLYGAKVGIIGYGNLGRALVPLLAPFGCAIEVYDPWLAPTYISRQGLIPVTLEELLSSSTVIFVLAAATRENKGQISREHLERVKKDALFILISRAHVVDFDALVEMADSGRFKAAIDVYPEEPVPLDHPVRSARNVVLTPHLAGAPARRVVGRMVVDDLEALVHGLVPTNMQPAVPELIGRRR